MVSKARLDLPDPERPVTTVSLWRGISRWMFFRLCWRAPRTTIFSSMAQPIDYCTASAGDGPAARERPARPSNDAGHDGQLPRAGLDIELAQPPEFLPQPLCIPAVPALRIDAEASHLFRIEAGLHLRLEVRSTQCAGGRGDFLRGEVPRRSVAEVVPELAAPEDRLTQDRGAVFHLAAQEIMHAVPSLAERQGLALAFPGAARGVGRRLCVPLRADQAAPRQGLEDRFAAPAALQGFDAHPQAL